MSSTTNDPFSPAPGAKPDGPAEPFHTKHSNSHAKDKGSSTTSGLSGTSQKFDDGTIIVSATEDLHAERADGLNASLVGRWLRVKKGNDFAIRQLNYSYKNRQLPDGILFLDRDGIPSTTLPGFSATPVKHVKATQFGKGDSEDEGTGSPSMGLIQTNSEVVGGSVKISIMASVFGAEWTHNEKRLRALIEVYFAKTRRMVRVPLVDVGPGEKAKSGAEVDLTLACDQFLGTAGLANVDYRILVPTA